MAVSPIKSIGIIGLRSELEKVINICGSSGEFHPDDPLNFYSDTRGFMPVTDKNPYTEPLAEFTETLNMNIQEWDPSVADFPSGEAFMTFVQRAQALSFYDTGVEVNEEDEIVTLITCDRSYAGADGRMVVMAVKQ